MSDTILIGGVFDPLHAGHLAYIREAQQIAKDELGVEKVVAAVTSYTDRHPPFLYIDDRMKLLEAFGVTPVMNRTESCALLLWEYQPKAYIKGVDWVNRLPADEVAMCEWLGIKIIHTDTAHASSTELLHRYERRRNTEKLAQFETWVRQQKPAEKPWEPVTDYSIEGRTEAEGPHAQLIVEAFDLLGRRPRTVLDVGCGPDGHLVRMLREAGVKAYGWDKQATRAKHCQFRDILWGSDLESDVFRDVVICREVLEHMTARQVAIAVHNLVEAARKFVYVTTRFTSKPHLLDCDVSDDLDPTHITMLNQDLLRTLFVLEGCTRRPDLEAKLDHMKKGRVLVYEVPA